LNWGEEYYDYIENYYSIANKVENNKDFGLSIIMRMDQDSSSLHGLGQVIL
jgi:hypothetical protein